MRENEKYLDSVQGKIDQFNNAVQSMWSDEVDSQWIKDLVSLGTILVQLIDKVGLFNIGLVGLFTYLQKKHGIFDNLFGTATDGIDAWRKQLKEAQKELKRAEKADARNPSNTTFVTKENARKRVEELKNKVQPYDDVDSLRKQRETLLTQQGQAIAASQRKEQITKEFPLASDRQSIAYQIALENRRNMIDVVAGKLPASLSEAVESDWKQSEQTLVAMTEQLAQMEQEWESVKNADKDLVDINTQLEETNSQLAEAELRLKKIDPDFKLSEDIIHDPEVRNLMAEKGAASQQQEILKFKRDQLQNAINSNSDDNLLELVKIDTKQIDDDIDTVQEKLESAQKKLTSAQNQPDYIKIGGAVKGNKQKEKDVKSASAEIKDLEKELEALQQKKTNIIHDAAQVDLDAMDVAINDAEEKLAGMTAAINAKTAAEKADNDVTKEGVVVDEIAALSSDKKTASTLKEVFATAMSKDATTADIAAKLKQVLIMKLLSMEYVKQMIASGELTTAKLADFTMTELLTLGMQGLIASLKAGVKAALSFIASLGPIGWAIIGITVAITAFVAIFSALHQTTEELNEKLDNFKSELSEIRSELDSVNAELEKTNEQMSELLSKDNLTFAEQEELKRLQDLNAELEHRKELLEDEEKDKAARTGRQAARVVNSARNEKDWWESSWIWGSQLVQFAFTTEEDEVYQNIDDYKKLKEKYNNAKSLKQQDKIQDKLDKEAEKIDEYIQTLSDALEGVEYGDSKESDKALDELAALKDTYAIARGSEGAKTSSIKSILKKEEFSSTSDAIDVYVKALQDGDSSAAESIAEIINNNAEFVKELEDRGLEAQDAIDLYTNLGENLQFNTLEGKTAELTRVTENLLKTAFNNVKAFMDGDEVDTSAIAGYFKGTSAETREEIAKLIQQINDGKINVDNALEQFKLFGIQSILKIEISDIQTNFKDVFTDLNEADGLIDTFNELAEAIGSTSNALDALNSAQAEMKASGRVSIETALKLMEYTDDYSKVLTISEGKLVLNKDAEKNLIEARIDGMKASAQKALEEAKAAKSTIESAKSNAEAALSAYNSAMETEIAAAVTASAWDKVLAGAAGLLAGIKSLITEESWTDAYNRVYNQTLNNLAGNRVEEVQNKYNSAEERAKKVKLDQDIADANEQLAEQNKEIERLQGNSDLINGLNKDNIGSTFKSDGFDTEEDAVKSAFDQLVSKYERELNLLTNERDLIEAEIDKAEATGGKASSQYYDDLIRNSTEEKDLLIEKKEALEEYLAANADNVDQDTWTEMNNEINETAVAIKQCTINVLEYYDALEGLNTHYFEQAMDDVSRLGEEIEFVQGLLDGEKLVDENGNWTEAGITMQGLYVNEMERAASSAAAYNDQLDNVKNSWTDYQNLVANAEDVNADGIIDIEDISTDELDDLYNKYGVVITSEEEFKEKSDELTDSIRAETNAFNDAKNGLVEMHEARVDEIKNGIEEEISAYEEYIDTLQEALDAERDLHDFKNNIKKQSKDIATLERRISALSGSTSAEDIAERRKLEAELADAREGINESFYANSRDAQSKALNDEANAFSQSKEKYITELEKTLEDTETLITNSIMDVLLNADIVYGQLVGIADKYGFDLSTELTQPWSDASDQATQWKQNLEEKMTGSGEFAAMIGEGGVITAFSNGMTTTLTDPWHQAQNAVQSYADFLTADELGNSLSNTITGFGTQINSLVEKWQDVEDAAKDAHTEQERQVAVGGNPNLGSGSGNNNGTNKTYSHSNGYRMSEEEITGLQDVLVSVFGAGLDVDGVYGPATKAAVGKAQKTIGVDSDGYYGPETRAAMENYIRNTWLKEYGGSSMYGQAIQEMLKQLPLSYYAKGTLGTKKDEWAITDELGDELVMYATPEGRLSYMRAGSAVIPHDLAQELINIGNVGLDGLQNLPQFNSGINLNSNYISKPDVNLTFDSLVHVDNCSQDTLKDLEKMIDNKIDKFSKQLNYSIKRFAR